MQMKSFKILLYDFNRKDVEYYDIMPYLVDTYKECNKKKNWWMFDDTKHKPETYEDFKHFVTRTCKNRFWSRCEYEFLMTPWPPSPDITIKIDGWDQIEANLDVVINIFIQNINGKV